MNKNFNNNDNESFMEGIYGCLERIETAVIELQKFQPNEGNSAMPQDLIADILTANLMSRLRFLIQISVPLARV